MRIARKWPCGRSVVLISSLGRTPTSYTTSYTHYFAYCCEMSDEISKKSLLKGLEHLKSGCHHFKSVRSRLIESWSYISLTNAIHGMNLCRATCKGSATLSSSLKSMPRFLWTRCEGQVRMSRETTSSPSMGACNLVWGIRSCCRLSTIDPLPLVTRTALMMC